MKLEKASVGQLLIPVSDFEAGIAFYRDTLGIPFLFSAPPQMAFFNCSGIRLLVGVLAQDHEAQRGSTIYFRVSDIHAVHASLVDSGVPFSSPPHLVHKTAETELWLAEFKDPDGNQLALMCETRPS
jgi:predicted enzyme related to lactoylglutathione lyase